LGNNTVRALAIQGTNIFAGTQGEGVFLSTNNGSSWDTVNTGLPSHQIYALAVRGTNIYAGTYGFGVFLSTNNGASWTALDTGVTGPKVISCLTVSGSNIFAGTVEGGVFASKDSGNTWASVNLGFPMLPYNVWSIATDGTNVYAGTDGMGVWSSSIATLAGIRDVPIGNFAVNVYPNPFTRQTTIVTGTAFKNFTARIMDVNGKEAKSFRFSGNRYTLETGELLPGIYLLQLMDEQSDEIGTQRMVIAK
jgi:hypothetical protein